MAKKQANQASDSFSDEQLRATAGSALDTVNAVGADEQADLVEAWVAAGNVEAVAAVAGEDDAPAPARKAARRGLNVLKARGVKVPERSSIARPFAQRAALTLEARFLPTDGSGRAVFSLLARSPGRDLVVFDVVYVDELGIVQASGGPLSGHRLREWEAESRRSRGFAHVEVPLAWARWRIAQLRRRTTEVGRLLPLELDRFAELLTPVPDEAPPHPATQLGLDEPADASARAAAAPSLHLEPEFRSFLVGPQQIDELLRAVGARVAEAGGSLDQDTLDVVLREELGNAVDRFFEPEVRQMLADRMLDALVSVHRRAGRERGLDLLATRRAVLDAGLITQPPRDIPFLRVFFEKALSIVASRSEGRLNIPVPARPEAAGPVLDAEQLAAIEAARTAPAQP